MKATNVGLHFGNPCGHGEEGDVVELEANDGKQPRRWCSPLIRVVHDVGESDNEPDYHGKSIFFSIL